VAGGRAAGDEAGGGRHEEDSDIAKDDTRRSEPPRHQEVARDAQRYPHRSGREVHTCSQDRDGKAAPKSSPTTQQILPKSSLSAPSRSLPRSVPSGNSSRLSRSVVVRPQALMPFSSRVSSSVLSQLWSILLAISSSSALFWRAASAVSVSPAFSARRSRSW
jgi:hypothetical protein